MNELKELRTEIRKIYREKQAECGLKIGDTVLVTHQATSFKHGWESNWDIAMDSTVGQLYKVVKVHDWGIKLSNGFSYPYYVLEKVITEKFYHVGQKFICGCYEYILARVYSDHVNLICIKTGYNWSTPEKVNNTTKITEKEMKCLANKYGFWNSFKLVE